jgi:hypothetical protein
VAGDANAWADGARPASWLAPDEQILWTGRPVLQLRVTAFAIGGVLIWCAVMGLAIASQLGQGRLSGGSVWFLFVAAGVLGWRLSGGVATRWWTRRRIWYAITTTRAVAISGRRHEAEQASPGPPVVVRRQRDRRHGTAFFQAEGTTGPRSDSPVETVFAKELWIPTLRSITPRRGRATSLCFRDVDHVDGLITAAQHAGFIVATTPEPTLWRLASAQFGLQARGDHGAYGVTRAVLPKGHLRAWISTRLLRHEVRIWSPLPPRQAIARLHDQLSAPRTYPFGWARAGSPYTGWVTQWNVRASYASGSNNSWRWIFVGAVYADDSGTWLIGMVGPSSFVPAFSVLWCGVVGIVGVLGAVVTITDLVTRHSTEGLPILLIPLAMLVFFGVLTEFASRLAASGWDRLEQRLRALLESQEATG